MIPSSSTEGAALTALMVPHLRRSISLQSNPGLTAEAISLAALRASNTKNYAALGVSQALL